MLRESWRRHPKKLAVTNALTPEGRLQVEKAAKELCVDDIFGNPPTWIYTSNTERAYESAVILGRECLLGQNRIVPEFSFLDARGLEHLKDKVRKEAAALCTRRTRRRASNGPSIITDGRHPTA